MSSDTVDGGKPPTLPKPAAAKKPERPSQLPPRPANRHQESSDTRRPVVPVHNFGDAEFDDLGQLPPTRPEVPRANERQKSATLGRKPISEPSGTVWSTSAGDIIGHRDQAPEPAPRVPKRPTGHNRGSSMGDPRQFHNLHGSDASPPLPPREKHHTESQKAPTAQIAELESVLEGKTSEMKKKLESLASPVHRPLPAGAHPSPLADSGVPVASLAHAIQGKLSLYLHCGCVMMSACSRECGHRMHCYHNVFIGLGSCSVRSWYAVSGGLVFAVSSCHSLCCHGTTLTLQLSVSFCSLNCMYAVFFVHLLDMGGGCCGHSLGRRKFWKAENFNLPPSCTKSHLIIFFPRLYPFCCSFSSCQYGEFTPLSYCL